MSSIERLHSAIETMQGFLANNNRISTQDHGVEDALKELSDSASAACEELDEASHKAKYADQLIEKLHDLANGKPVEINAKVAQQNPGAFGGASGIVGAGVATSGLMNPGSPSQVELGQLQNTLESAQNQAMKSAALYAQSKLMELKAEADGSLQTPQPEVEEVKQ